MKKILFALMSLIGLAWVFGAKVTAPLMSITASGQFGKTLVFDKRGRVRQYVIPANPKTTGQMLVRNTLGDIQRSLVKLGLILRGELRTGFGSTWNAMIIAELTKNDKAYLTELEAAYTAYSSPNKANWATADTSTPVELADGLALYAAASAAKAIAARLGVTLTLTAPIETNSATVGAEWIDSTP